MGSAHASHDARLCRYAVTLHELMDSILRELDASIGALSKGAQAAPGKADARALMTCSVALLDVALARAVLSPPIIALATKLYAMALKVASEPRDRAQLKALLAHVSRLAAQHGGKHTELFRSLETAAKK